MWSVLNDWKHGFTHPDDYQICLPQLTLIKLESQQPHDSATFLAHVDAPALRKLKVLGDIGFVAEHDVTETLLELLPENSSERIPFLKHVSVAALTVYEQEYCLSVTAHPSSSTWLEEEAAEFVICSGAVVNWKVSFGLGLRDLLEICRGARLTRLEVTGDHNTVDRHEWSSVFRAFPTLEILQAGGRGLATVLWDGLRIASTTPSSDGAESEPAIESDPASPPQLEEGGDVVDVACPRLQRIDLVGDLDADEELFAAILECLQDRADRSTRLDMLCMALRHNTDQDYERMKAKHMRALEALAGSVEYHDMESYEY
ncbi:hypothetical protein C8Q80DRAFT_1294393 [Daedaleopsis nitida]|nr:hypothetical protein C8Q80DRAFT_1294393 [Daedaleopsis nitida]